MSEKQEAANQRAFEKGQSDWREGKAFQENYYPPSSPYSHLWEQGWQAEHDIHNK